jgi:methyl farnesoate epoxidase/farnesoate epoxidase
MVTKFKDDSEGAGYISRYAQEQSESKNETFTDKQLVVSMMDFFTGGSGTISKTLSFCILYMLHYPKAQEHIRDEVNAVGAKEIDLHVRDQIPYTEAFIMEVQRLASVLPIAPPRLVTSEITIGGYTLRKGVQVQMNLYAMHCNKEHWGDPDVFRPERFLNEDGSIRPDEWFQPFGYGKIY